MTEMPIAEKLARLQLARAKGLGAALFDRLVGRFGSGEAALAAIPDLKARGRLAGVRLPPPGEIEDELAAIAAMGAALVLRGEADYPQFLAAIDDPPLALACHGRQDLLHERAVAIVGARNASANGRRMARRLAAELASAGLVVVSGLARGIDAAAHEGALEAGGDTVAVIASGIDLVYPPEHAALQARIVESGLLLSERPLGAPPTARQFPRRNRIIAGLSLGVLVVEAAERSGSLMTARLAGEQGREVMAVPGSPMDERHKGTNRLIREGALLVEAAGDVIEALPAHRPARPKPAPEEKAGAARTKPPAPERPGTRPASPTPPPSPGTLEERVAEHLGPEPLPVDELVRQCHASAAEIQGVLVGMELDGRIERLPGNRVALVLA